MLKIGLTGGIGSGKTTVANLFKKHNTPILDADEIAHALVEPQQPALQEIVKHFGKHILTPKGYLNRDSLRQIIFASKQQKRVLEAILHPLVYQTMHEQLADLSAPYAILCIPLLIETGQQSFVDRILVVECTPELQQKRIQQRDKLSQTEINQIISAQSSMEDKRQQADDLIQNNTDQVHLGQQVNTLHLFYLSLSTANNR